MSNKSVFIEKNVKVDAVVDYLNNSDSNITEPYFPFDGSLKGNPNELITQILFINYLESTQIKNKDINKLKEHIQNCLSKSDYDVLRKGELTEKYYSIVDKIAVGHGICGSRKNKETNETVFTEEHNLTSFATKFCGHYNQKAPFWDNLVSDLINYLGYKCKHRDYRAYISAFKLLQKETKLEKYSLRQIESAMWFIADKAVNPAKYE